MGVGVFLVRHAFQVIRHVESTNTSMNAEVNADSLPDDIGTLAAYSVAFPNTISIKSEEDWKVIEVVLELLI